MQTLYNPDMQYALESLHRFNQLNGIALEDVSLQDMDQQYQSRVYQSYKRNMSIFDSQS